MIFIHIIIFPMARPLRPEYTGAIYYVSSVGNRGQRVFQNSADGNAWIEILDGVCERFGCRCFGYCLMSDGYHLVIETPKPNLSKAIRQLNGVYTQRSNRLHDTSGHVFRGRYKSIVVQREKYLLRILAHIFLLPLRAGFVKHPNQFKWSSCRYLYGKDEGPRHINLEWFSERFSSDINAFDEFLEENSSRDVISETRKQIYLGDDEFIEFVQEKTRGLQSKDIPRYQLTKPVTGIINSLMQSGHSRNEAIAKTYLTGDYTLREVADAVSVHYSVVSKIISEYEKISSPSH
ncbi:MAG: transposase [Candidatus Dadabacteria bacterium]|nr:transposase [Candidatus Dadabacteria bacterium]